MRYFSRLSLYLTAAVVVSILGLCALAEASPTTLTIHMSQANIEGTNVFLQRYPQVTIKSVEGLSKEDIFSFVLTQSSEVDLFGSNTNNLPSYPALIARGFYSPIQSPKLQAFVENCYPGIKETLYVDGELAGVPVWCLQCRQLGVERNMWQELGLEDSILPVSYMDLFDFIKNRWPEMAFNHPDWCAMTSDDYWLLFFEMLNSYNAWRANQLQDPGFDTPLFRETLEAWLSIDPDTLCEDSEAQTALFTASLLNDACIPDLYSQTHYEFIPIGISGEPEQVMYVVLGIMVINPYTTQRELCEAYLECLIDTMSPDDKSLIQENYNTPVHFEGWEDLLAEYEAVVDSYNRRISAEADTNTRHALELEREAYIHDNEIWVSHPWRISTESLARFHSEVDDLTIVWDEAMNERDLELFDELCANITTRSVPVDVIISQLDRLYFYRTVEGE